MRRELSQWLTFDIGFDHGFDPASDCAGDRLGRKKVYGMTLMLMVFAAIASGLSFGHTPASVMTTLCFFRFWLGFGIGGDYPLSATIMSEYANTRC